MSKDRIVATIPFAVDLKLTKYVNVPDGATPEQLKALKQSIAEELADKVIDLAVRVFSGIGGCEIHGKGNVAGQEFKL